VLVLLGELGAVVVGSGGGVADVGGAGGAGDGDVKDGLGLIDVRVGDVGVACLFAVIVEDGVLGVDVVALLGEVGGDRALENGVVAPERATGKALESVGARDKRVRDLVHSSRRELVAGRGTRPVCEDLKRA